MRPRPPIEIVVYPKDDDGWTLAIARSINVSADDYRLGTAPSEDFDGEFDPVGEGKRRVDPAESHVAQPVRAVRVSDFFPSVSSRPAPVPVVRLKATSSAGRNRAVSPSAPSNRRSGASR